MAEHCARLWAARGESLCLAARDPQRLETIRADLRVRGASAVHKLDFDAATMKDGTALIEAAVRAMGGIDVALIAHGTLPDQAICEQDAAVALEHLQINALSVVELMRALADTFETQKSGTLAVISSVAGDRGRASNTLYGSAKAMVTAFASGLRQRLSKAGVVVLTIKPGFVDTPMTATFRKGLLWAQPATAAARIVLAIDRKFDVVYVPSFWWLIMNVIRHIPEPLFKKLPL